MKIAIKKIYIVTFTSFVVLILGYLFLQQFFNWLSYQRASIIILPIIFLLSLIYSISYWIGLKNKEKVIDEVSKEEAHGDFTKELEIKNYLSKKIENDTYLIKIFSRLNK